MTYKQKLNILGLLLVFVVSIHAFGALTGNSTLYLLGQASAMAPMPAPFRDHAGYENFASARSYEISFADGSTLSADLDRELLHALGGPHRHKIVFTHAASMLPRLSSSMTHAVFDSFFCKGGVKDSLEARYEHGAIQKLTVVTHTKTIGREWMEWRHSISCDHE